MRAVLHAVQPYELHGVRYYQLQFALEGEDQLRAARISHDVVYPDPSPGDQVDIELILGVVNRVRRIDASQPD